MLKEKIWEIVKTVNDNHVKKLSSEHGLSIPVCTLLLQRNLMSKEQIHCFFHPQESSCLFEVNNECLYNPFLLKGMEKGVQRLHQAILVKEKIVIYGDYDVDGITSTALLLDFLTSCGADVDYFIPDRHKHGYGLSIDAIDEIKQRNVSLIITVDCGTKSVQEVEYAKTLGIDIIITDHHLPGIVLPDAIATINPKLSGQEYPFTELSGCAVGFKFIQAYSKYYRLDTRSLKRYLDLVVISIASDTVPIINENRVLAHYGLTILNSSPRKGLERLIKLVGLTYSKITIDDIIFKITPRLNAAGRIGTGDKAVELLIADDDMKADQLSQKIDQYNLTRKDVDRQITEEAIAMIDKEKCGKSTIVLFHPSWHKGVLGIVASRISTIYGKPTVIFTQCEDIATGSARSVQDFDLYQALQACEHLLDSYGGHTFAAGLNVSLDKLDSFVEQFDKVVAQKLFEKQTSLKTFYDAEIGFDDINPLFYKELECFEPFGPGNIQPVFMTRNVYVYGTPKHFGKQNNHLQLELYQDPHRTLTAIGFDFAKYTNYLRSESCINICYSLIPNTFRNEITWQIRLKDIQIVE